MKTTLLICSLLPLSLVLGQETWNVDTNGNWGTATNWNPQVIPNAQGATATFGNKITASRTITLDISPTVGILTFDNSTQTYQIIGSAANSLTFNVSTGSAVINLTNTNTASQSITGPLILVSPLSITQGSNSTLTLGGVISGGSGISLSGNGTGAIILSATNTFSGGLTLSAGTIQCAAASVLPTSGTVALNGGTLNLNSFAQTIGGISGTSNVLLGTGALTVSSTGANSYGGQISGGGSLTVGGTGSLTLTVAQSYNGGTTVSRGSLILGLNNGLNTAGALTVTTPGVFNLNNFSQTVSSFTGSGAISLGTGSLTINGNHSTTYSGVISGSGGLILNGTATTTFSGQNKYTGGTTLTSGTLQLGAANSLPSTGSITMSGGTLDLNNFSQTIGTFSATGGSVLLGTGQLTVAPFASANFAGAISGSGSVVFQGPYAWILQTAQTYTGGTIINGGTLQMGSASALASTAPVTVNSPGIFSLNNYSMAIGSLAGTGDVAMGSGNLTLNTSSTTTFAGAIVGAGQLTIAGTGTQILTGSNSYSGGTVINGSAALQGTTSSLQGTIVNVGTLSFNQSFAGQYSGPLSGGGTLQIGGGGVVTLTGTPFQAHISVVGAELDIALGSTLSVSSLLSIGRGAALGGGGTISGSVSNGGTINPGSKLTVTNDVTFQPGSYFVADLSPTSADQLVVLGNVTIQNGSQVIINASRGEYEAETRYAVITSAAGPVVGQFQDYQLTNPFLDVNFIYNELLPGSVEVDLSIRSLGNVIQGGNAGAIASCLTLANMRRDEDLENMIADIIFFSEDKVWHILDEMQPSELRELTVAEQVNTLFAQQMISGRLSEFGRTECERGAIACHPWNVWTSLAGNWTEQHPSDHNVGYQASTAGFAIGFDGKAAENLFLGVAVEYGHTAFSWKENRGSSTINRMSAGPYLSWVGRFGYLNMMVLGSLSHFDTTRKIHFFSREATSSHYGQTLLSHVDGGVVFHPAPGVSLTPFAAGDLIFSWEDSFKETGAEALNFSIASSSSILLRTEVGLKVAKCSVRSHGKWVHDLKASWVREERFKGQELQATFRQFPCRFTVQGLYPSRSLLNLGMGLSFLFKKDKLAASLRYEGQFGEGVSIQSGIAQFLARF